MNQLHIDDSYSRQAQINWPVLSARRECCLEGQACPVAVHDERQEAYANRHTPWDLYHFLDVHGTENSEEGGPENIMAWLFPAFGMLFVLQALYLLVGHYLRNWLEWKNVEYAVTNRRTVVRRGLWRVFEVSRPHSGSPIEVRAGADGAVGDIKFQALGKPAVTGLKQQLESIFNPDRRTGEFVLSAVQNPNDVYRTILTQASAGPNIKSDL